MAIASEYTLDSTHRCDVCGARAYIAVWVRLDLPELLWCMHHGREVEPILRPKAILWVDESDALNVRLDASA